MWTSQAFMKCLERRRSPCDKRLFAVRQFWALSAEGLHVSGYPHRSLRYAPMSFVLASSLIEEEFQRSRYTVVDRLAPRLDSRYKTLSR